ncbi:hypothetical protein M6D81_15090 [Paenibacillus sp. J5C_2022]|uniref:hypothetical protein n=1 Tax=Paenibacillus sp. J5C2022 TaxID=2977129 RepID=UPI0021D1020C|nr:hypothetical protein [Paenibacillus sp. J5C2022]MCU6710020.1 hypothetical protein [Paenibacillus sp. J5C2022]
MRERNSMGRLRHAAVVACVAGMAVLLAGCLYPKENMQQNRGAANEAVRNVQAAVDQYLEVTGLLPIQNSTPDVPKFEKFKLNFAKLQAKEMIGEIPSVAFEKGGNYYFIVIDEEKDPKVKLMDIVSMQKVNDIQIWMYQHIQNTGELPKLEAVYPGFYEIDYKTMGKTAPVLKSVYSGQTLRAVVDESGAVYLDYAIDITQQLQKNGDATLIGEEDDLRDLLVAASPFVPVKAPAYRLRDGEPVAVQP